MAEATIANDVVEAREVGLLTVPDARQPWAEWPVPVTAQSSLHKVVCVPSAGAGGHVEFWAGDVRLGRPSIGALKEMATRLSFPVDFVQKLTPETRAAVINERIMANDDIRFTFTAEDRPSERPEDARQVTNISPGWRGVLAPADVCQTVWALLCEVYGPECRVKLATRGDSECRLTVMTPFTEPITPAVGDTVGLGVGVWYSPGMDLRVALLVERLRCLNGMRSAESAFDWGARAVGRPEDQVTWLTIGVANALASFDELVERSRIMAATVVDGDPEAALIERARAMRVPQRFDDRLRAAWQAEPGNTEWSMLNAFTHLATHGGLPTSNADAIQTAAGAWTQNFDMVTARLPRPVAISAGAHIIE